MSDPAAKLALDNAILEWKRKHNIRDHDPILANLEILEIYFNHRYANGFHCETTALVHRIPGHLGAA